MANYAVSVLAKGQTVVTERNQAPEQRRKMPTVMELAFQNQQYSIPNANEIRSSELRAVEIYYQKIKPPVIPQPRRTTTLAPMVIQQRLR